MSNSCFRTCTVVLIYCAVLFAQVSVTVSVRDSQLSKTRELRSKNSVSLKHFYENHPSLHHVELSDEMRSLLVNLKRKKRLSHHGRMNKIWNTGRVVHLKSDRQKTSTKKPIISIDYIENPISKEADHESQLLLDNNDIALDDLNQNPIFVARRDVRKKRDSTSTTNQESTVKTSTPLSTDHTEDKREATDTKRDYTSTVNENSIEMSIPLSTDHTEDKREAKDINPGFEVPVVITEVVEGSTSTNTDKLNGVTVYKRQATNESVTGEPETTCVTLTGLSSTNATTETTNATSETTNSTADTTTVPPSPMLITPSAAAALVGQSTIVAAIPSNENETCEHALPCHMSDTLSEILQNVESLADQKMAANEDFPCSLNGSWMSEAGGVRLDIVIANISGLSIEQGDDLSGKKPKPGEGFMRNSTWSLRGTMPLENKGMIIINGVNEEENQLATFIGECKVCHHSETVAGHWLYTTAARDCTDQKNTFKILSDLWRRESMHSLKRQFLRNHDSSTSCTPSASTTKTSTTHSSSSVASTETTATTKAH